MIFIEPGFKSIVKRRDCISTTRNSTAHACEVKSVESSLWILNQFIAICLIINIIYTTDAEYK